MAKGDGKTWARGKTAATDERVARIARGHIGIRIVRRTPPDKCKWVRGRDMAWSRGLTKEVDARVRRNAEKHVGLHYQRRIPHDEWSRKHSCQRLAPLEWSTDIAYAVGLIATDGNLSTSGRHVRFISTDLELVETFLRCVGHRIRYRVIHRKRRRPTFEAAFSDVELYRWLLAAGLTPRKSLTLGPLAVQREYLADVVRGLLDGDGSIAARCYHRRSARPHRHIAVVFHSASPRHLNWLASVLQDALGVSGRLSVRHRAGRADLHLLTFNTDGARRLLGWVYRDGFAPRLERKWSAWSEYLRRAPALGS